MSAQTDYLRFLINLRREWAERARAVALTAIARGTRYTADETAMMELAFQKMHALDNLIPRQQAIVETFQERERAEQRERAWRIVEARHKVLEDRAEARRIKKLETERQRAQIEQELTEARQVPAAALKPKGMWLTRTVAPRDDDVTVPVAEVDALPAHDEGHYLVSQVEREAATLISWHYKSLNIRRQSRRYEGYRRAAYG